MKFSAVFTLLAISNGAVSGFVNNKNAFGRTHSSVPMDSTTLFATKKAVLEKKGVATEAEIRDLFYLWNDALATGDSKIVAKRYAKDAVLLPTVSDTPRTDFDSIKDYFDAFLQKKPQGVITEGKIKMGEGWANDAGIYEFTMGADGSKVKARYTYFYVFEDGQWKISHHHSSVMPEGITVAQEITKEEVQGLFGLWNDALATLDSSAVADRYSKNAVLLPTVSDIPRTDREGITDYFNNFLQLKPQGVIEESNVVIGANWAQDAGIYEFTLGKDGSKVRARYSFIYVYEDGTWKISHHHSSAMPEASKKAAEKAKEGDAPTIDEDGVRALFGLWNDALATGDADKVAERYAKKPVLLATVSDKPRTDYDSIKDYFVGFLQKEPQGVITDGNIEFGNGWAKDVGVYEFTMGVDGAKVLARYSFFYVYEDGEWKISHHHSSAMPEGLLAASEKIKKLEEVFQNS